MTVPIFSAVTSRKFGGSTDPDDGAKADHFRSGGAGDDAGPHRPALAGNPQASTSEAGAFVVTAALITLNRNRAATEAPTTHPNALLFVVMLYIYVVPRHFSSARGVSIAGASWSGRGYPTMPMTVPTRSAVTSRR
jgi:hypothetical protein